MRRVLLLEDSAVLRDPLATMFRASGWVVGTASTLKECRALIASSAWDVVVVDRNLPDGDGTSIVAEGPPIIVFSGDGTPVAGAAAMVLKPSRLIAVIQAAERVCRPMILLCTAVVHIEARPWTPAPSAPRSSVSRQ